MRFSDDASIHDFLSERFHLTLSSYKKLGERALAQVADEQLFATLDPEMNSLAIVVKHMAGNMRSRWTDFIASDGEKPDRDRDSEFEDAPRTRAEVMRMWTEGWACVFAALEPLAEEDRNCLPGCDEILVG